jgi:hypothetical protein
LESSLFAQGLLHRHEMGDTCQHAADIGTIRQHTAVPDTTQTERAQRAPMLGLAADARSDLRHPDVGLGFMADRWPR